MAPVIELRSLCKRYGSTIALDKINLSLDRHAPTGLVGKNGAGKTTLLSILCGAITPSSGTVKVLGLSPTAAEIKGKITILLQDANFKKGVPVLPQLHYFARLQGLTRQEARLEIAGLLERFRNMDYAHRKPETLSYGQRKRLAIVQAFIGAPQLVLLDEPTAGLDPVAANDIRGFIQSAGNNTAFIVSSHNLYEIEDICTTIIVMDKGKLIASTEIADLAGKNDTLNLTLERKPTRTLLAALSQLPEITEIIPDKSNQERITLHFVNPQADQFQLHIQSLIIEQGFSIVHLSRGKTLVDGVIDLVDAENQASGS
ncbi:MAG: ABC transporter ATP-binding protein [Gammaproteobacteria bacterium]